MSSQALSLFAVHISDNVLGISWWGGGLLAMAALVVVGAWRVRDEEIPRVALLTAAYFVATAVHFRIGPTSIHLLCNGLIGVLLGRRACLAIPLGVLLQYLLLQHGGFYTVGINSCVQIVPALAASYLFAILWRLSWWKRPSFRSCLIGVCFVVGLLSSVFTIALLSSNFLQSHDQVDVAWASYVSFHPMTLVLMALTCAGVMALERRLHYASEFALGLFIGELTVLLTVALTSVVLLWGGGRDWLEPALIILVGAVPLAVIEGVVLGFTVAFLARVKPELLGERESWIVNRKTWLVTGNSRIGPTSTEHDSGIAIHERRISNFDSPSTNHDSRGALERSAHVDAQTSADPPCPALERAGDASADSAGIRPSA